MTESPQYLHFPHLYCIIILYPTGQPVCDPSLWEKEAASSDIYASLLFALSCTSNAQPNCLHCQSQRDSSMHSEDVSTQKVLSLRDKTLVMTASLLTEDF